MGRLIFFTGENMGYKTNDPKEVQKLQEAGYSVTGMHQPTTSYSFKGKKITNTNGGLVYEFNFDDIDEVTAPKVETIVLEKTSSVDNTIKEVEPEKIPEKIVETKLEDKTDVEVKEDEKPKKKAPKKKKRRKKRSK